ncbi:MAG: PIN domain-containing protein [Oscillospiraceae bacterium]|jgi:predicted nucleic acid-binding protein|nr:PIN domain-containing protein [Oscillospiraceae bacterium]
MTALIDTNVILDFMLRREPYYENAAKINILSEKGYISAYISASAVTDIFYIAKKELRSRDAAVALIKSLLKTIRIASVTENSIHEALDLNWDDFEDCVQYVAGRSVSADYVITRNPNDFADSQIYVISPDEFLAQITSQN